MLLLIIVKNVKIVFLIIIVLSLGMTSIFVINYIDIFSILQSLLK